MKMTKKSLPIEKGKRYKRRETFDKRKAHGLIPDCVPIKWLLPQWMDPNWDPSRRMLTGSFHLSFFHFLIPFYCCSKGIHRKQSLKESRLKLEPNNALANSDSILHESWIDPELNQSFSVDGFDKFDRTETGKLQQTISNDRSANAEGIFQNPERFLYRSYWEFRH